MSVSKFGTLENVVSSKPINLASKVSKSGDVMFGDLDMGGNRITKLSDPTNAQDAVNKEYADGAPRFVESFEESPVSLSKILSGPNGTSIIAPTTLNIHENALSGLSDLFSREGKPLTIHYNGGEPASLIRIGQEIEIQNLADPTHPAHAVNKRHLDAVLDNFINAEQLDDRMENVLTIDEPKTMVSNLDMGTNSIINVGPPVTNSSAINKRYLYVVLGNFINPEQLNTRMENVLTIDEPKTMVSNLDMGTNSIINLGSPVKNSSAINKKWFQKHSIRSEIFRGLHTTGTITEQAYVTIPVNHVEPNADRRLFQLDDENQILMSYKVRNRLMRMTISGSSRRFGINELQLVRIDSDDAKHVLAMTIPDPTFPSRDKPFNMSTLIFPSVDDKFILRIFLSPGEGFAVNLVCLLELI